MPLAKNKGPLLESVIYGDDAFQLIPREFKAFLGIRKTDQEVPTDILPDLLLYPLIQSQVVQERTNERKKTNVEIVGDIDVDLPDETFIQETGQVGHRTRRLVVEGTDLVPTDLTWSADQHNLGNGLLDQTIVTLDEVFDGRQFSRERSIVTPEDFRALLQTQEQAATVSGSATPPDPFVPGDGLIKQTTQQLTDFHYRASETSMDLLSLPIINENSRTNQYKQVESVDRVLKLDTLPPFVPTALRNVTFTKLGDGTAIEERASVDALFENLQSSIVLEDVLPAVFKASLPTYIREFNLTDLVDDPPVLDPGDFERTETQYDVFNKRVRTRGRAGISYPQDIVASRQIGPKEYGGGLTKTTGYLDTTEPPVETGVEIVSSKVQDLGNGTWFRETEKLDPDVSSTWPTLEGVEFDKEMQVYVDEEVQTVASSYTVDVPSVGEYFVETKKPIDAFHSRREKITKTPTATDEASAIITEAWRPYQFPGWLAATGFGYYVRKSRAELCQHITKTWWMSKATKPTTGVTGSGADVEIDPIVQDNIIISTLNNTSTLAYSGECLHDDITTFGTLFWAETTPNMTDYTTTWIGTPRKIAADIVPTEIPKLWKIQTTEVVMR